MYVALHISGFNRGRTCMRLYIYVGLTEACMYVALIGDGDVALIGGMHVALIGGRDVCGFTYMWL